MSNLNATNVAEMGLPLPPMQPAPPQEDLLQPRSWLAQVVIDTFGYTSARLGAAWIIIVAFCAAFAPLLAGSFPILQMQDHHLSSPLLKHLTAADFAMLAAGVGAIVLFCFRKISVLRRFWMLATLVGLTFLLALIFAHPPQVEVYDRYRVAKEMGRVQWAILPLDPHSPGDRVFDENRADPQAPSLRHWLGTDLYGADIFSHMIHATRIAMAVGFISTGIALLLGCIIGGLMGYFSGIVDLLGMRLVEIVGAIPTLYLLLTFVAVFERNIYLIMAIIGLTGWVGYARFVRAEFLKLRQQDFVHAAVASGLPLHSILFRHLLPNALAPILVTASFGVASAILTEASLSFLGLGLPIGEASWGNLLNQAISPNGGFYWWLATFPGIAIFLTVFGYNLIGESFRDALDPTTRGRSK